MRREKGKDAPENGEDLAHLPDRKNLILDRGPPLGPLLLRELRLVLALLSLDRNDLLLDLLLLLVKLFLAADTKHGNEHVGNCSSSWE